MLEGIFDLGEIDGETFECSMEKFITSRSAVVGMSGSGKSHLIGVIAEELSENGASFIIIDPEGEYSSLKEKYEVVWAGKDPEADIKLSRSTSKKLAKAVVEQSARLILDTSLSNDSNEEIQVISSFLDHFYELETKSKRPILLVVEEADRFAPQSGGDKVKRLLEISRRGRKRGIGLLIATQRPQMVDKNVLSQCGNQLIGKLRTKNDLKAVDLFFSSSNRIKSLPELRLGEFYAMGEFNPGGGLLKVKGRTTSSLGSTPEGRKKRKTKFSVDDFVSDIDDIPRKKVEKKEIERQTSKKRTVNKKEKRSRSTIKGMKFKTGKNKALAIAKDEIDRTIFTGKSKESIDSVQKLYWPFMHCMVTETKRSFFRMKKNDHQLIIDPVQLNFIRFKDNMKTKVELELDKRIMEIFGSKRNDHWKDIRILRHLQKEDMTSSDLSAALELNTSDTRSVLRSLSKKKLVTTVGKAGTSSIYRPLIKVKEDDIKDISTELPVLSDVEVKASEKLVKASIRDKDLEDLVKGLFDNCDLVSSEIFYLPFYLVYLHHRKKRTQRCILINGVTEETKELEDHIFHQMEME